MALTTSSGQPVCPCRCPRLGPRGLCGWPGWLSSRGRESDLDAEPGRSLGRFHDVEGAHAGRDRNRIRREAGARVEKRLQLEPQRLLAPGRELLLPRLHRLPGIAALPVLAQMEEIGRAHV